MFRAWAAFPRVLNGVSLQRRLQATLSHVDSGGQASMVDVSPKPSSTRTATAQAFVELSPETVELVRSAALKKGDIVSVTKIAGIMAAKRTSDVIPLCHSLALDHVDVTVDIQSGGILVECLAKTTGRTGVEMEAMHGASVAALTVYDMIKGVEKGATIRSVKLLAKSGGQSGSFAARL